MHERRSRATAEQCSILSLTEGSGASEGHKTPQCVTYDSKRSDADSASTISTVGYIGGGVLLAGAVATFIFWPKSREKTRRRSKRDSQRRACIR